MLSTHVATHPVPSLALLAWLGVVAAGAACGARTLVATAEPVADATPASIDAGLDVDAVPPDTARRDAPTEDAVGGTDVVSPPPPPNPFRAGDRWVGTYTCPQGLTQLDLEIVSTAGNDVTDAVFDFDFTPAKITGSFHMSGIFAPATLAASFVPGAWVQRPVGWNSVGMTGTVALATMTYSGEITAPGCGSFSVRRMP
jgi:hypothetical protein